MTCSRWCVVHWCSWLALISDAQVDKPKVATPASPLRRDLGVVMTYSPLSRFPLLEPCHSTIFLGCQRDAEEVNMEGVVEFNPCC